MTHLPTHQSRCRFGIASDDITPPVGIYHRMWGAATHDRSEGVHRPLSATAMYFGSVQQHGTNNYHILIAVDHCLLGVAEVEMILERAATQAGLARDAITITFSHTHAAGLLNLDRHFLYVCADVHWLRKRLIEGLQGLIVYRLKHHVWVDAKVVSKHHAGPPART